MEEEEARLEREEQEKQQKLAKAESKAEPVEGVKDFKSAEKDAADKREQARSAEERAKEQEEKARQAAWGTRLTKATPSATAAQVSAPSPASRPKSPASGGRMRSDDMPRDIARVRPASPGGKWKHEERSAEPPRRPAVSSVMRYGTGEVPCLVWAMSGRFNSTDHSHPSPCRETATDPRDPRHPHPVPLPTDLAVDLYLGLDPVLIASTVIDSTLADRHRVADPRRPASMTASTAPALPTSTPPAQSRRCLDVARPLRLQGTLARTAGPTAAPSEILARLRRWQGDTPRLRPWASAMVRGAARVVMLGTSGTNGSTEMHGASEIEIRATEIRATFVTLATSEARRVRRDHRLCMSASPARPMEAGRGPNRCPSRPSR